MMHALPTADAAAPTTGSEPRPAARPDRADRRGLRGRRPHTPDIHLGPLLVAAPALTAAFAGPGPTAVIGTLAVAAQVGIGLARGVCSPRTSTPRSVP
ncbi:hypothetical protein O1L55_35555 [Streptomyces albulus]|nr:hypothetical protein [Streptomyces noursei]